MDLMLITAVPPGSPRPAPATVRWLSDDEDFTAVRELGAIGPFVSQDIAILGKITQGIRNNQRSRS
jgi:hypothetical protein